MAAGIKFRVSNFSALEKNLIYQMPPTILRKQNQMLFDQGFLVEGT